MALHWVRQMVLLLEEHLVVQRDGCSVALLAVQMVAQLAAQLEKMWAALTVPLKAAMKVSQTALLTVA